MKNGILFVFLSLLTLSRSWSQTILRVTPAGGGDGSGSNWENAIAGSQLVSRLAAARYGTSFWLAGGTYKPSSCTADCPTTERSSSFSVNLGVSIYGGFVGNDANPDQRNINLNPTTLSGDIGQTGIMTDNSYHVVTIGWSDPSNHLDGLIIRDGNAETDRGGGLMMYMDGNECSPSIVQCRFINNKADRGGGVYARITNYSPTYNASFTDCEFSGNSSTALGGAFYGEQSYSRLTPQFVRCRFLSNTSGNGGGAVATVTLSTSISYALNEPRFINCLFAKNSAAKTGGAIHCNNYQANYSSTGYSKAVLINCTLTANSAPQGGAIYVVYALNNNMGSQLSIYNSVIWNNAGGSLYYDPDRSIVTYSLIAGGAAGTGNIDGDPRFADEAGGNYQLTDCSPAVNAGENTSVSDQSTDLAGQVRIFGGKVDMGAYELQSSSIPMQTVRDGNWNDPLVWSCGRLPLASDLAILRHVVTMPTSYKGQAKGIQYDSAGRLVFASGGGLQLNF